MLSVSLNICGITSEIKLLCDNTFYNEIKKRYRNFLSSSNKHNPDISLSLQTILPRYKDSNDNPSISDVNRTFQIKGSGFDCKIANKNGFWKGRGVVDENIYQFDTLLRLLYSQLLLLDDGFLIHSCGISYDDKGYLFPGLSGSGKTTLAKKTPYLNLLSDELVGVKIVKDKPYIMGTPFWGNFQQGGQPISSPLHGIYFLKKDKQISLEPLMPLLAVQKLLRLILFFGNERVSHKYPKSLITDGVQRLLNLFNRHLVKTPIYQIRLAKNTTYKTIMKTINQHNGRKTS